MLLFRKTGFQCTYLVIIVLCSYSLPLKAQQPLKPLVVLIEHNPWLSAINADEPTIALYTSGLVIYKVTDEENHSQYYAVQLSKHSLDSLKSVLDLGSDSLYSLQPHVSGYKMPVAGQPYNDLYIFARQKVKAVSIYGELSAPFILKELPKSLAILIHELKSYRNDGAKEWKPDKIELMLWPFESAPDVVLWPSGWPGLKSINAHVNTQAHTSYAYMIDLDSSYFGNFIALYRALGNDKALLIDNRKWSILFRYPLPGEKNWRP